MQNNSKIFPSSERGSVNFGWLQSHHSFSFGSYYNPERIHFGALRVLNDDKVAPGMGFSKHPHENMEIISIPLSGGLKHRDSMGNETVIQEGEVQIMSAGTGVQHSEMNNSHHDSVEFLQIWIFPDKKDLNPSYGQVNYRENWKENVFNVLVSPSGEENSLRIHQNAWLSMAEFDENQKISYHLHDDENGVFFFLLSGELTINATLLTERDALEVIGKSENYIDVKTKSRLLVIEVPLA